VGHNGRHYFEVSDSQGSMMGVLCGGGCCIEYFWGLKNMDTEFKCAVNRAHGRYNFRCWKMWKWSELLSS